MSAPRLVLASASPARLETLHRAGVSPEVTVSGVDETLVRAGPAVDMVAELARRKALAVAARVAAPAYVLGCDSMLELDGRAYGKPASAVDAVDRWRRMRGRSGVLHTGHCLIRIPGGRRAEQVASSTVHFAEVSDVEIDAYVATGEPLQVAGAFTVDGLGAAFVERIDGDPSTVVGLSLPLLRRLFLELDVPWPALWGR